jgi:hypothetical protein
VQAENSCKLHYTTPYDLVNYILAHTAQDVKDKFKGVSQWSVFINKKGKPIRKPSCRFSFVLTNKLKENIIHIRFCFGRICILYRNFVHKKGDIVK